MAELRSKEVAQACPLCRTELPPGLDGLFDLAYRATVRVQGKQDRGELSLASLPPAEQEEIAEAISMLTEAVAQGHVLAQCLLGNLLKDVRGDVDGAEAAYRAAIKVDPKLAGAHKG